MNVSVLSRPHFWLKFLRTHILLFSIVFLSVTALLQHQILFEYGPHLVGAQEEDGGDSTYGYTEDFSETQFAPPPEESFDPPPEDLTPMSDPESFYQGDSSDTYGYTEDSPNENYFEPSSGYTPDAPNENYFEPSSGYTPDAPNENYFEPAYGYTPDAPNENYFEPSSGYTPDAPNENYFEPGYYNSDGSDTYGYTQDFPEENYQTDQGETYGYTQDYQGQDNIDSGFYNGDTSETYGYTEDLSPGTGEGFYDSDGTDTYGYTEDMPQDYYQSDGSETYGYTQDLADDNSGGFYNSDGSETYGYTEDLNPGTGDGFYNTDGSETYGYTQDLSPSTYPSDGSETYGYTQDLYPEARGSYQGTTYSAPAGSVTSPTYYSGPPQPQPGVRPERGSRVDYICEGPNGTTQVYYRIYDDGSRVRTGPVYSNSAQCGYYPPVAPQRNTVSGGGSSAGSSSTSSGSSNSSASARGGSANVSVNVTNPQQSVIRPVPSGSPVYASLTTTCSATPASPRVGDLVTWIAFPVGGSGNFDYRWIGVDPPLPGRTFNPASVTYSSAGLKRGEIRVFDRDTRQSATAFCEVTVIPINQTPQPTVVPTTTTTTTTNTTVTRCPEGTIERSRTALQLVCERPVAAMTNVIARCPEGTVERSRGNGEIICEQAGVRVVQTTQQGGTIGVTPTLPGPVAGTGTVASPQKVVLTASGDQPQVVTQVPTDVKELPKTGLPLAGVALGSLVPMGLRLRKKNNGIDEKTPNSIWMEREFKR